MHPTTPHSPDYPDAESGSEELADRLDVALSRLWNGDGTALRSLLIGSTPAGFDGAALREAMRIFGGADATGMPPGTRVGEFTIIREIGRGGMGIVYEAKQRAPARSVALKVMRAGDGLHPRRVRMFQRETELLARLTHPGIAAIFGAGCEGDPSAPGAVWYYAMELVRGRPLQRWVAAEPAPPLRQRLRLIVEVCEAIHSAHENGIVHRDIKPSNVMVDEGGRARVLDFGLARLQEDGGGDCVSFVTQTGQIVGTLPYMSPEQIAGDRSRIDRRTDVYALGALLYEVLTGKVPFDVSSCPLPEAARIIREEQPDRPSSVLAALAGDLDVIIRKTLEKSPERRYQSAAALADDLRRHLANRPILARPPTMRYRMGRLLRRNRGAAAGLVIAMLAVVAGVVVTAGAVNSAGAARSEVRRTAAARHFGEYVSTVQAAYTAAKSEDLNGARALLAKVPPEDRGWEWEYLAGMIEEGGKGAEQVLSDNVWANHPLCNEVLRQHVDGTVELLTFDGGEPLKLMRIEGVRPYRMAVTADRRYAIGAGLTASGAFAVHDTASGKRVAAGDGLQYEDKAMAVDERHSRFALGGRSGRLRLFSYPDLSPAGEIVFPGDINEAAFSPDGERIAAAYWPSGLRICRVADETILADCDTRGVLPYSIVWSPDGRLIASLSNEKITLNLWDAGTGELIRRVVLPEGPNHMVGIGDSGRLAVASWDGAVRVFMFGGPDGVPWAPVLTLKEGPENVNLLSAARDGSWVYAYRGGTPGLVWRLRPGAACDPSRVDPTIAADSGAADGCEDKAAKSRFAGYMESVRRAQADLRIGDVTAARRRLESAPVEFRGWEWRLFTALCSPARGKPGEGGLRRINRELMTGYGASRSIRADRDRGAMDLIDPVTLEVSGSVGGFGRDQPDRLTYTEDGVHLLSVFRGGLRIHRGVTGALVAERFDLNHQDWAFVPTPDSTRLVVGGRDGIARVLEIPTLETLEEHTEGGPIGDARVSRDGSVVVLYIDPGVLRLRRLDDWSLVRECAPLSCRPGWATPTADGGLVYALTHCDRSLIEISARTGLVERRTVVPGSPSVLCLFPDESRIAVGCSDGSVLIYPRVPPEGEAWEPIVSLREHSSNINSLWVSRDMRCMSADMNYQPDLIWDAGPVTDNAIVPVR